MHIFIRLNSDNSELQNYPWIMCITESLFFYFLMLCECFCAYCLIFTYICHARIVHQLSKLRHIIHISFAVSVVGAVLSFVLGHLTARDMEVRRTDGKGNREVRERGRIPDCC